MSYKLWLKASNFKVVTFYPYTSIVTNRILEQNHNYKTPEHDFLDQFASDIKEIVEKVGCKWDNKVVVELEAINDNRFFNKTSNIFIGWYDGRVSVGLGIYQPDTYTKQYNITVKPHLEAIDPCIMADDNRSMLSVGQKYEVLEQYPNGDIRIKDDDNDDHYFLKEEINQFFKS